MGIILLSVIEASCDSVPPFSLEATIIITIFNYLITKSLDPDKEGRASAVDWIPN